MFHSKSLGWFLLGLGVLLLAGAGCSPTSQSDQHLARADRYLSLGDYEKAEADYLFVAREEQESFRAYKGLGLIYFDQGRMDRAGAFLSRARQISTNDLTLRVRLATVYLSGGSGKDAREEALYVLEHQPADEDAALVLAESVGSDKDLAEVVGWLHKFSPANAPQAGCEAALAALALQADTPDLPAAMASIRAALAVNPKSAAAYASLGVYCQATNGLNEADAMFLQAAELSPPHSPRWLKYAKFKLLFREDFAGARKVLNEIVKRTPDYILAWLELARLSAAERKTDEAQELVTELLNRDPDNFEGLVLNAGLNLARGENATAINQMEKLTRTYAKSARLHYDLARAYLATGDQAKAGSQLHTVLNLDPKNLTAALMLAQLDMARGDLNSGIFALKQLVAQKADWDAAWKLLARGYYAQGDYEATLEIYRRLAQAYPTEPGYPLTIGRVLIDQAKLDDARKSFEHAFELNTNYPATLPVVQELVRLDLTEKKFPDAERRVEKLIAEVPSAPEPLVLKANVLLALQTLAATNQALAVLRKATDLRADYWTAYVELAKLYKATGQNQAALSYLQGVVAKNPKDIVALMLLAVLQSAEKDYASARTSYETILNVNPRFAPALNNAAYLYCEHLINLDRAFKLAAKARDLQPYNPVAADTFGWVQYRRGEFAWAANLLTESANNLPDYAEVHYHLGMAQYMMGREEASSRELKRALELDPQLPQRAEVEQRLAMLSTDPRATNAPALAALEKRLAEFPNDVVALARLAVAAQTRHEWDRAEAHWRAALKASPDDVAALSGLAELFAGPLKDAHKGLEFAQKAHKLVPDQKGVARLYARLAFQTGDYSKAYELLHDVVLAEPEDAVAQFELAEAAYYQGEIPEALAAARLFLAGAPDHPRRAEAQRFVALVDPAGPPPGEPLITQALAGRAEYLPALMAQAAALRGKDSKGAIALYERILALRPKFIPATRPLALLYASQPATARLAYKMGIQALAFNPSDAEVIKTLGLLTYSFGEYERCAQFLPQIAGDPQEDAHSLFCLGISQMQLKRKAEARDTLQKALSTGLAGKEAEEANQALKDLR